MSILNIRSFKELPIWVAVLWITALGMAIAGLVILFTEGGITCGLGLITCSTILNNFCLRRYQDKMSK